MADQPERSDLEGLPDVSALSDRELFEMGDSTLAAAIRRLVANLDDPNGLLSGFQSFTGND